MSNYAYETLGRVTWVVGKRIAKKKVNEFLGIGVPRRRGRTAGIVAVLAIAAVGGAAVLSRQHVDTPENA